MIWIYVTKLRFYQPFFVFSFSEYASKIENILDDLHLGMESELVFDDPEQKFLAQIYHILTNFFKPTLHILHSKTLGKFVFVMFDTRLLLFFLSGFYGKKKKEEK